MEERDSSVKGVRFQKESFKLGAVRALNYEGELASGEKVTFVLKDRDETTVVFNVQGEQTDYKGSIRQSPKGNEMCELSFRGETLAVYAANGTLGELLNRKILDEGGKIFFHIGGRSPFDYKKRSRK